MPATPPPPRSIQCPKCGQRLAVRTEDAGRSGRCHQCGQVFLIGGVKTPAAPVGTSPAKPAAPPPRPASFTFGCSLCQTRITVPIDAVGRTVKCPDCHRQNLIPAPPAPVVVPTPAAMAGPQYDLWTVDDAPTSTQITARAPTLHPVHCELCQTLMYATDRQVGTKLKCPDCGAVTLATSRQAPKPKGPVLVPAGEEYQLDEASAPTPRYVPIPPALRAAEIHAATRTEVNAPTKKPPTTAPKPTPPPSATPRPRGRSALPAIPLLRGVSRMLLTSEVFSRWVVLSAVLVVVIWLVSGITDAMGYQAFVVLPKLAGGCMIFAAWAVSALPFWLAVVTESSEGNDRLEDPPYWLTFEFGEAFVVAISMFVSAVPAWLAVTFIPGIDFEWQIAIAVGAWLLCFPVALLSALDQGSAFGVFSPRLASSLVRCAGPWLLFYIESAALAAAAGFAVWKIAPSLTAAMVALPFLAVGVFTIYMRLLGRLAWWIAEKMSTIEEVEDDD